ncbi:hypothetical protein AB0M02_02320 [Actinoplanes sp. NPDC051861]|uniref:hypothetical protein n=1 Tax=Actinoplanes sp. NPDC051861 TaxID=3155170 RepID=UPI00341F30D7
MITALAVLFRAYQVTKVGSRADGLLHWSALIQEAEGLVQETYLYRIATDVCLSRLASAGAAFCRRRVIRCGWSRSWTPWSPVIRPRPAGEHGVDPGVVHVGQQPPHGAADRHSCGEAELVLSLLVEVVQPVRDRGERRNNRDGTDATTNNAVRG